MDILKGKEATQYILSHDQPVYPFPFLPGYWKYLEATESANVILIADEKACIPILERSRMGFVIWQFLFPPIQDGGRLPVNEEKNMLDDLVGFAADSKRAHRIIQPPNYALFKAAPDDCIQAPFGSYVIDLVNQDLDKVFMGMKSNYRQVIRKAEREGVEVRTGKNELDTFYTLYEITMKRSGVYQEGYTDFVRLCNSIPDNVYCSSVWYKGQPEGALFATYSQYGAYILHAGTPNQVQHNGSMKLLHWDTMKVMKEKGVKQYDFVGARLTDIKDTPYEGLQRFKSGFGSQLLEGILWKIDIDSTRCKMMDSIQYLRHGGKTPGKDIIDQERERIEIQFK